MVYVDTDIWNNISIQNLNEDLLCYIIFQTMDIKSLSLIRINKVSSVVWNSIFRISQSDIIEYQNGKCFYINSPIFYSVSSHILSFNEKHEGEVR